MTELMQVYRCDACGIIVEVLHAGDGQLVCCGQPMNLLAEQNKEMLYEKHVPVIEKVPEGSRVKVGAVPHPMEEKHYIEWIEVCAEGKVCRKFLKPGARPEAIFNIPAEKIEWAREYCNIHGLWKAPKKSGQ